MLPLSCSPLHAYVSAYVCKDQLLDLLLVHQIIDTCVKTELIWYKVESYVQSGLLERVQVRRDICTRCFFLDLAIIYRKSLYACVLHRIYDECLSETRWKERWKVILAKIGSVEDERNKRINIREGKKEKKKTGNPTIICSHLFLRKTLLCAALSFLRELCSRLHSRVPCSLL